MLAQVARDADLLVGGMPESCLIIDETSFIKQGERSVGVARQWSGRLGKVDNCQVAVFAVLSDGRQNVPIDMRLYLPRKWIEDEARCTLAGVPASRYRSEGRAIVQRTIIPESLGDILKKLGISTPKKIMSVAEPAPDPVPA